MPHAIWCFEDDGFVGAYPIQRPMTTRKSNGMRMKTFLFISALTLACKIQKWNGGRKSQRTKNGRCLKTMITAWGLDNVFSFSNNYIAIAFGVCIHNFGVHRTQLGWQKHAYAEQKYEIQLRSVRRKKKVKWKRVWDEMKRTLKPCGGYNKLTFFYIYPTEAHKVQIE